MGSPIRGGDKEKIKKEKNGTIRKIKISPGQGGKKRASVRRWLQFRVGGALGNGQQAGVPSRQD